MSDYSEHLISMAGGDGELSDAIATLEDRAENGSMRPEDRREFRLILNHMGMQKAVITAVRELADMRGRCGWRISADEVRNALEVKP